MAHLSSRSRLRLVVIFFTLFFSLLTGRLFFIQIFNSGYLLSLAKRQHNLFIELEPTRGIIFDRNLRPQALNIPVESLYASPHQIKDKRKVFAALSEILDMDKTVLWERLNRDKSFVWLERKLLSDTVRKIQGLRLQGLGFMRESKRSYPNTTLASHIIGFAGLDNQGLEGLELLYDKYLKGKPGWCIALRDARQRQLLLWKNLSLPQDGYNLVLTIDEVIQYIAERELDKAFRDSYALGASIVVMDPYTGEILALANRPTFDLNSGTANLDLRRNRAICDFFEPGSVFKIVAASAALEEKTVTEEDNIFCENGQYRVANHILHDHRPHGLLTFRQVIEQSSNIGTTKVAQKLGTVTLFNYIKKFGFGEPSGVDLPGEVSGVTKEPNTWSKTSIGAVPIGHEVCVTALQLAEAISVIANGGVLIKPYVVKYIIDNQQELIKEFKPVFGRRVISENTSLRMKDILTGAVESGTGKMAKVAGYKTAGKTGTAQKVEPNGTYSHEKFIASFIGFVPSDKPVLAIAVVVDEPWGSYYGGTVAAPVFKNVSTDVLKYLKTSKPAKYQFAHLE